MQIYRVVDAKNKGLYNILASKIHTYTREELYTTNMHPPPKYDIENFSMNYLAFCRKIKDKQKFEILFGFANKEQLRSWLTDKQINAIYYFDGKILEIDIPDNNVCVGNRQCIFNEEKIELVRKTTIEEWI